MSEISDELNKLFQDLGIENEDPLLKDEPDLSSHSTQSAMSTKSKHVIPGRCTSLPFNSDALSQSGSAEGIGHKLKYNRSWKERALSKPIIMATDEASTVMLDEFPSKIEVHENIDDDESKCESLPPTLAVKVCPRKRYRSIVSKVIESKRSLDAQLVPKEDSELRADRVAFHLQMASFLLASNSAQETLSHSSFRTQRSEEEVQVHQEISEMIWLELQAWHAGQYRHLYDNLLLEKRQNVYLIYEEVMNFTLKLTAAEIHEDCFSSTEGMSPTCNIFWPNKRNTTCSGCLSIWCEICRGKETDALNAVFELLEKVDNVHSLFPSSQKLIHFYPLFAEEKFVEKYKSLCLWFNITTQLRFVIHLLGLKLEQFDKNFIPWPIFPSPKFRELLLSSESECSKDSGRYSSFGVQHTHISKVDSVYSVGSPKELKCEGKPQKTVAFQMGPNASTNCSSNPSQSTESIESGLASTSTESSCSNSEKFSIPFKSPELLSPPIPIYGLHRSSSDVFLEANPYRKYVEKLLRNKGMKNTLSKVADIIRDVMSRSVIIIEMSHPKMLIRDQCKVELLGKLFPHPSIALREELSQFQGWTSKFASYGLPSIHTLCLFLASVPLHMMMECLKIRLQQEPHCPSSMSIKQLMAEYKEGIKFGVLVREKFSRWCSLLVSDLPQALAVNLEARKSCAMQELDENVKKMLQVYLNWLDQLILMMQSEIHVSGLHHRNFLQDEWLFIRSTCAHVTHGKSLAAIRFCKIACHMLINAREFFNAGLTDAVEEFNSSPLSTPVYEHVNTSFELRVEGSIFNVDGFQGDSFYTRKKMLVLRCRSLHKLISDVRERSLRAILLAKMLKLDLEVAFEARLPEVISKSFFKHLTESNHVLVKNHSLEHMVIFIPDNTKGDSDDILSLLQMHCDGAPEKYVILLNLPPSSVNGLDLPSANFKLSDECISSLSQIKVNGLLVIANNASQVHIVRNKISDILKGVLSIGKDLISPHLGVTEALVDMKTEALHLCQGFTEIIQGMEELLDVNPLFEPSSEEFSLMLHLVRDTIHQGFCFGFEYHKEVFRLICSEQKENFAPILIIFGRLWMKFAFSRYPKGKGCRPRWAVPGFEFLLFVCDPHITTLIGDLEFAVFSREVEECYSHVVGSASTVSCCDSYASFPKSWRMNSQSSTPSSNTDSSPDFDYRYSPWWRTRSNNSIRLTSQKSDSTKEYPIEAVREAIELMDEQLELHRLKNGTIGRVTSHHRDDIELQPRTVGFSWHRGFKIGSGHFGKVYSAINNNNGEFMAMKCVPLQMNDRMSIKRAVRELDTFERISHPNLVKYFGVEVHSDEMLIFMEYCDEGTLNYLSATSEGLPEEIVRKYTHQLLSAVHTLHDHGIVHRDIKGANIFLAMEANILKLGDFGCAVRLRGMQTEINELFGIVGTHAFMAPEIFRSNEGYGRAADIWSVGCVVVEMLTGKRPWSQYDSSVQIMFQVGSGKSPDIPEFLSEEGMDFLSFCFVHCPKERATASKLMDHAFVKVVDEDINSLPLFSHNVFTAAANS